METYEYCANYDKKKKFPTKVVVITAASTFILTILLAVILIFASSALVDKFPILSSIFSSGSSTVEREVRAYINSSFMYDIDEDAVNYGAAKGMVEALGDPYTRYLPPDEFAEYLNDSQGNYIGIGIIFTLNENNEIMVVGSYPGSPGEEAGIKSGDILLSVDGKECTTENYNESISYIRGEHIDIKERENTDFELEYLRRDTDGTENTYTVTLTRKSIHVNSVSSEMIDEKIGYIAISSFNTKTHDEFAEACDKLIEKGMEELIIDLRDNGGGDFNVVIEMAGWFLDDNSLVVYTEDKNGYKQEHFSDKNKYSIKPVILINGSSASASEVFCGALRDHEKVTAIVGSQSFGKGITQNVYSMMSGGGLIVTVDTYYTPDGDSIHKKGITPTDSVEIQSPYNEYPASYYTEEIDTQKAYAINLLRSKI